MSVLRLRLTSSNIRCEQSFSGNSTTSPAFPRPPAPPTASWSAPATSAAASARSAASPPYARPSTPPCAASRTNARTARTPWTSWTPTKKTPSAPITSSFGRNVFGSAARAAVQNPDQHVSSGAGGNGLGSDELSVKETEESTKDDEEIRRKT